MKSELAIERDKWFESDEGKKCTDTDSLLAPKVTKEYLINRLEAAFLAGATANEIVHEQLIKKMNSAFNRTTDN